VAFVDEVLRHRSPKQGPDDGRRHRFPVLDIRGDAGCGKTWTVVTLAARFAAATVPSQFKPATLQSRGDRPAAVPRVVVLDSLYDITATKLAYAVRSALLLRTDRPSDEVQLQRDTECCCRRIHVATASRTTDWVAALESIHNQLVQAAASFPPNDQHPPTLVLWDGFLDEPTNEAERTEVIRQLVRILHDCPVMFVSTASPSARRYEWEKHVTHRVRLQRDHQATSSVASGSQQRFVATVLGNRIPYSISLAGILS
jgi:hypothetical protein